MHRIKINKTAKIIFVKSEKKTKKIQVNTYIYKNIFKGNNSPVS